MNKEIYKNMITFHPGYYLEEMIEAMEMTQEEFARRIGTSGKTVSLLLNGQSSVTKELAVKLSAVTGVSAETYMNLQKNYDLEIMEMQRQKDLDAQTEIADMIDYSYFTKHNLLPKAGKKTEKVKNLCTYLKVSDLRLLTTPDFLASYRTTVATVTLQNIVNANVWLQTAFNIGSAMEVESFDGKKLKAKIYEIRRMTRKRSKEFIPELKEMFRQCGVAFVILPALKNSGVSGVVKWYKGRVVMAISDKFTYEDSFWFSLFHEIKHVLQKKITKILVNYDDEKDADDFAVETLLPKNSFSIFLEECGPGYSEKDIVEYAELLSVDPGIVVSRLCHDGRIPQGKHAKLRKKFVI